MDRAGSWQIQDALDSDDFSTLAGAHDMLLHRHEDPLEISRISHAYQSKRAIPEASPAAQSAGGRWRSSHGCHSLEFGARVSIEGMPHYEIWSGLRSRTFKVGADERRKLSWVI
jgi:hypothetical protein